MTVFRPFAFGAVMRLLALPLAVLAFCWPAAGEPAVRLDLDSGAFRLEGWPQANSLPTEAFPRHFRVYVDTPQRGVPPLAGAYRREESALIFEPKYPLEPGLRLRAEFRPAADAEPRIFLLETPAADRSPSTVVEAVYPSADVLPENLLKFYLHFSAPMSRGVAYRHVSLLDEEGRKVELPFLELEQELWDSSARRLTIFFDPGRVKRELLPHRETGLPVREGHHYRLVIDSTWPDAEGKPLARPFEKRFRASAPDYDPPNAQNWTLQPPSAGTAGALTIRFPEPMDAALAQRMIGVASATGESITGRIALFEQETLWKLTPEQPWRPGRYVVEVNTAIEDLAGNSLNRPFEVDVFEKVEEQAHQAYERLAFEIPLAP